MYEPYQMPYQQGFENPYLQRFQQMQAPQSVGMQRLELSRVNGLEGARAFQIPPNSATALFDGNEDIFYIKTSDAAGLSSIRKFKFSEIVDPPTQQNSEFVTRKEFDEVKGMILNVQQLIQKPTNTATGKQSDTADAAV